MPAYISWKPWSQSNALELASAAHEKTVLDLKERYDVQNVAHRFELAKDLAAFANALGGTVLVGVSEKSDQLGRKTGRIEAFVPVQDEQSLIKAATVAARDLCRPSITVEPEVIKLTTAEQAGIVKNPLPHDTVVIAFNVHPLLASPAGVAGCDASGTRIPHAYRFPIRFLEGTKWLHPEELAFHMNSHERRIYLLLAGLRRDRAVVVWDKGEGKTVSGGKRTVMIADLDAERLILKLELAPQILAYVPLTFVAAAWLDENDQANIDVNGALKGANSYSGPRFVPLGSVA
jgi:hypothetical protein